MNITYRDLGVFIGTLSEQQLDYHLDLQHDNRMIDMTLQPEITKRFWKFLDFLEETDYKLRILQALSEHTAKDE